jgi:hypothetical protein
VKRDRGGRRRDAGDGGSDHEHAAVGGFEDVFGGDGLPEARLAGAGVELGFGAEEGGVAADATDDAFKGSDCYDFLYDRSGFISRGVPQVRERLLS